MKSHKKHLEGSIVQEEHKHPAKRSRSNIEEEAERGRKRARVNPAEEQPQEKAPKKKRTSDHEEHGLSKRARMSPSIQHGKKRSRASDAEEEQGLSKRVRMSPLIQRGKKRSRTSDAEEEQGLSKRARMSPLIQRGIKRSRTSYAEEDQGLSKRVRMSPPIQRGIKRSRTSDDEDEVRSRKKERTSDNQGEQTFRPGGGLQICLKPKKPFGQSLEDYQFHRVLGQGGFGKVMLASLKTKNQLLAVKVIDKNMQKYESVLTEKDMLQMARGSPFLCHGLAAFQTQERCYLVMEYMCGGSLHSYMMRSGVLGLKTASFYFAEIICGIQYLHLLGIIHRDLKPENILLDGQGHIRIADFGLAVQNIIGDKKAQGRAGTPRYMAPEVIANKPYDASADYWSLGVILCHMMTRRFPFNNMEYIREVLNGTPSYPDWLPSDAVNLLNKLLDKDPESRLGVNGDIEEHPFFSNINWKEIEKRQAVPPFLPFTFEDTDSSEQYSFMNDESSVTEDHVIQSLSFVVPEWKE